MKRAMALVALALTGCGGSSGDEFEGTKWAMQPAPNCATLLEFANGRYTSGLGCLDASGAFDLEADSGPYQVAGSMLTMTQDTGCPGQDAGQVPFTLTGPNLALTIGNRTLVFTRVISTGSVGPQGGTIVHGCWNPDGSFSPQ